MLAVAGCASLPDRPVGGAAPAATTFSPERFFAGATRGDGVLRIVLHHRRAVRVLGTGRIEPDGTLILSQRVTEGDKPPRMRRWTIRQIAPGRYAGTLSDAASPVTGVVAGPVLHFRFRMAGGLAAEQRLVLQADGRTVANRLTVRKLGIVVAVLRETIRRTD